MQESPLPTDPQALASAFNQLKERDLDLSSVVFWPYSSFFCSMLYSFVESSFSRAFSTSFCSFMP